MTKTSGKNTAKEIDELLKLSLNDADITQPDTHCSVKQKLETMLGGMGITCDDIGAPKDALVLHPCDATTYGTCAANVALAGVVEDIYSLSDADFTTRTTLYTTGANLQTTTLQAMAKGTRGSYSSGATFTAFDTLFPLADDATTVTMWNDLIS